MTKKFIDLFAGAGGMSCGLEMAGLQCLLGVDHEETAIETFKHNHKYAKTILGDIRNIVEVHRANGEEKVAFHQSE